MILRHHGLILRHIYIIYQALIVLIINFPLHQILLLGIIIFYDSDCQLLLRAYLPGT